MAESDLTDITNILDTTHDETAAAIAAIQRHGLRSLLTGTPTTITDIADQSGLTIEEITSGADRLISIGRIELDEDIITGVAGLTLTPTVHSLRLPEADMHTWCALDAIGIPTAFELTATVTTKCPNCNRELVIDINGHQAQGPDEAALFCPTGPCTNVRSEFCTATNLFCNPEHLALWRDRHGDPDGAVLDLEPTAELGRQIWAPHTRFA